MPFPHITLDPTLGRLWPESRLGCLFCTTEVLPRESSLWNCLETETAPYLRAMLETTPLAAIPNLAESRQAYKAFGKDPGRFRISSDALYRRIRQGKGLYQINSLVDANNLVSLETGFSLGSYDAARIDPEITFRLGTSGETYPGIGRDEIDLENMPLLADSRGAFGCPTSDSTRAMITTETQSCLTVIFSFSPRASLEEALARAIRRFGQYVRTANVETRIVE